MCCVMPFHHPEIRTKTHLMSEEKKQSLVSVKNAAWFLGYVAMMLTVYGGMDRYRDSAMVTYGTEQARENWQDWREAADAMAKDGPVERDKPKSQEPPSLVLMRDHFAACLGISLLLSSCLFVWFMVCVRGALRPVSLYDDNLDPVDEDH